MTYNCNNRKIYTKFFSTISFTGDILNKSLLFIMTLSGTEVFILYILFYPFAHKYFSIRWRYLILKISMVFYLVPFAWFKFIILKKLYELFPALKAYFVSESEHIDLTNTTANFLKAWSFYEPDRHNGSCVCSNIQSLSYS